MNRHRGTLPQFFSGLPVFSGLSAGELKRIAEGSNELDAPRGTILFHRGETADGLYILMSGQLKLSLQTPRGEEKVVDLLEPGRICGEAAIFLGKPYAASAETLVDSKLVHIPKELVVAEIQANPALSWNVIRCLSERVYKQIIEHEIYVMSSGLQRVIRYLLDHQPDPHENGAVTLTLPAKKWIIASQLNLTQEHFSRILHDLVKDDLIKVEGRNVAIPDIERLRACALADGVERPHHHREARPRATPQAAMPAWSLLR
jgi:CRP-like cAMP-binding protein